MIAEHEVGDAVEPAEGIISLGDLVYLAPRDEEDLGAEVLDLVRRRASSAIGRHPLAMSLIESSESRLIAWVHAGPIVLCSRPLYVRPPARVTGKTAG